VAGLAEPLYFESIEPDRFGRPDASLHTADFYLLVDRLYTFQIRKKKPSSSTAFDYYSVLLRVKSLHGVDGLRTSQDIDIII